MTKASSRPYHLVRIMHPVVYVLFKSKLPRLVARRMPESQIISSMSSFCRRVVNISYKLGRVFIACWSGASRTPRCGKVGSWVSLQLVKIVKIVSSYKAGIVVERRKVRVLRPMLRTVTVLLSEVSDRVLEGARIWLLLACICQSIRI